MITLFNNYLSLRFRLVSAILLLALVGFSMVLITGILYSKLTYQNQRNAITGLIGLKITNALDELSEISTNMGLDLQTDQTLRQAIKDNDIPTIQQILETQFNRFFITAGVIKLKDIYIFDENFRLITNSNRQKLSPGADGLSCANLISMSSKRTGADRLKPVSHLCTNNHESSFGVIVPVDSLNPFAYMAIISDPAFSIIQLEKTLGDPIKIVRDNGNLVYKSPVWPAQTKLQDYLVASHVLRAPDGATILKTSAARDIEPYRNQLFNHAAVIIGVSAIIFVLVIIAVMYTLKAILKPLDELQNAAQKLGKGDYVEVSRTSVPEIDIVIQSFNHMAQEITELIKKLQREIMERKKTESTLKKHRHDLSLARDQAFAASRAKSVFLANMSHELRTPLNAIIGYAEMLFDETDSDANKERREDLLRIQSSGKHLLTIIDDILDLSKIEAGKLQLNIEEFAIYPFVLDTISTVRPLAEKNGNIVTVDCDHTIGVMQTDPVKLRHSLLNILDNACKFTKNGKIDVTVKAEQRNGDDWIRFTISDTGIGISNEQARHLFSEFTQVDSSTTKSYSGTGLGLALSLRFCELMGGHITYQSELGNGSVFEISIPRKAVRNSTFNVISGGGGPDIYKSA